jgi:hypothetical protein
MWSSLTKRNARDNKLLHTMVMHQASWVLGRDGQAMDFKRA